MSTVQERKELSSESIDPKAVSQNALTKHFATVNKKTKPKSLHAGMSRLMGKKNQTKK